jgi:hypothetical protein
MENVLNYLKPQQDKYSDEWDTNMESEDKIKMLAKLDMLADLSNYIDCLREGYTRTLKMNNVVEVNNDEASVAAEEENPKVKMDENYRITDSDSDQSEVSPRSPSSAATWP